LIKNTEGRIKFVAQVRGGVPEEELSDEVKLFLAAYEIINVLT